MTSRLVARALFGVAFVGALLGCHKVPLRENPGTFDVLAAHWFENEKTQYVFFSISGLRPDQAALTWPSRFELKSEALKPGEFVPLDLSKGRHKHRLVSCGEGRVCGSFSYEAAVPSKDLAIRYFYHDQSQLHVEAAIPNSAHPAGDSAGSQSALVFGVFSEGNERVQVRVHDNFGTPNDEAVERFGLERVFEISNLRLADVTVEAQGQLRKRTGTDFLFPADAVVDDRSTNGSSASLKVTSSEAWISERLSQEAEASAAVFRLRLVDRAGQSVREAWGLARRNPVLQADSVSVRTPMREARKIPLVISYCPDREESSRQTSALFLDYQRFILGLHKAPIDVCFAVGEEERFARELEGVMTRKIAEARVAARADGEGGRDFFFTVIVNHRLSPVIVHFHREIVAQLAQFVRAERALVSPRLVGAFVYDSDALESRGLQGSSAALQSSIVWCPRIDLSKGRDGGQSADVNCASYRAGEVDLGPLNFLIPMGPFPTLDTYVEYVQKHGDKGLSKNPNFVVKAIQTNPNSVVLDDATHTFFDGERVTLLPGEGLRFCRDRDPTAMLGSVSLKIRDRDTGAETIADVSRAQIATLEGKKSLDVAVGIQWEFPFLGGLTFDTPVRGKVFNLIPIQTSIGNSQKVGDEKWSRETWPVGPILQKCVKYCDHPFFDEAGVYQLKQPWRTGAGRCVSPKPVAAPGV